MRLGRPGARLHRAGGRPAGRRPGRARRTSGSRRRARLRRGPGSRPRLAEILPPPPVPSAHGVTVTNLTPESWIAGTEGRTVSPGTGRRPGEQGDGMTRKRSLMAGLLLIALVLAACGSSKKSTGGGGKSTTTATPQLTASFRGVTADSIKIGIVIIDYKTIADFVDFTRGDQQKIAQSFVDDINANGGVLGRKIVPVYKTYKPIGNQDTLAICTALTQDEKVFAVLGVFIDFSGDSQLCLTRDHQTIHIGHE